MKQNITCAEVKKIDLVDYLSSIGYQPIKIRNNDYWYLSPLRDEKTASFKVNRKFNVWYDQGIGKGGNLIDFGIQFHHCSVAEFLEKISQHTFSFHPPHLTVSQLRDAGEKEKIAVVNVASVISNFSLQKYLLERRIPLKIACRFCDQVDFKLYDKKYTAIGFKNRVGGYELRSAKFQGSSSPKDITFFERDRAKDILIFEGFMDFLSYQTIHQRETLLLPDQQPDFLILNSLSFFEKAKEIMEKYPSVHLFLDRDAAGIKATQTALAANNKYRDQSIMYKNHKDLNEYLISEHQKLRQSQGIRKMF